MSVLNFKKFLAIEFAYMSHKYFLFLVNPQKNIFAHLQSFTNNNLHFKNFLSNIQQDRYLDNFIYL